MHYFIYAQKDATIYSGSRHLDTRKFLEQNTGLDSILELEKTVPTTVDSSKMVSRIVVYFNLIPIKKMIDSGEIPSNAEYNLRLFNAHSSEIPLSYDVYAYPLSQSIQMGIGKSDDKPINSEGVTWLWPDTTGSVASSTWDGGNWLTASDGGYTSLVSSQSYEYTTADINMDVTTLTKELLADDYFTSDDYTVDGYVDEGEINHGYIIKRSDADEDSDSALGTLQFFSIETNTIYVPKLEIKWDDTSWNTGTLSELDAGGDVDIYMKGLRESYLEKSEPIFRLYGRERYPTRTISKTPQDISIKYLPSGSTFYSVKDAHTEETIIDYDSYTGISCDSNGNYFKLKLNGLQPERFYKIIYKTTVSGSVNYYDNDFSFKVVR
tara:strand:+ start:92 stop:1231 length:1140 start_codon:yes stop_codon:yes gene_type:complete